MDEPSSNPIAEALLASGVLSQERLELATVQASEQHLPLVKVLVRERYVTEGQVCEIIAAAAGLPYIDPDSISVNTAAVILLSGDWARKMGALPFELDGTSVVVAVSDPTNMNTVDDLRRLTSHNPILVLSPPEALARKIEQVYRSEDELDDLSEEFATDEDFDVDEGDGSEDAPVIRYVNLLLNQAIADRASDIHIEPTETDVWVRFRIDGVLHDQMRSPKNIMAPVVSRIKIMGTMDIAERRMPQDGRLTVRLNGRKIDLRVATIPTVYGEKVVLRILDNASAPMTLTDVGMSEYHEKIYSNQYNRAHGLILVCGPTGSGKSTTLYTTLNTVKKPELNLLTVEDPVEYRMSGVSQIQINKKAGLTFATALRSILRADPDIILVGEIRDRETAQISVEAALTGHLVLSTLHTNDAPSAVTRLIEMGIEPFLVGSSLNVVVAQRLIRRLCQRCSKEFAPTPETLTQVQFPWENGMEIPLLRRPVGCPHCSKTGYRGRTSIHEVLVVSDRIERMANDGAHTDQIRNYAVEEEGMKLMRQDGWEKVLAGETTIEEVLRVSS